MENKLNMMPEFTQDTPGAETGTEEAKKTPTETSEKVETKPEDKVEEKEKETPTELPADTKPAEGEETPSGDDAKEALLKEVQGLQRQKELLSQEIQGLRGTRRDIKEQKIEQVQDKIDELKDMHPDDVKVIERVLQAKGYVTKEQAGKITYDQVKNQELSRFLEKYPEYKPENDKNDLNWNALQRELGYYRMPDDPSKIREVLEKAHKSIQKPPSDRTVTTEKKLETAGVGAGGTQRSSSKKTLTADQRDAYRAGGWSEEEIKSIEDKL